VGGEWRSRLVEFLDRPGLRPTPDRVRETVFNWLGQRLDGKRCLDLFAGSGALGFEAASRGAREVVLVETDRATAALLRENAARLGAAAVRVVDGDGVAFAARPGAEFDVVFLDPPFDADLLPRALAAVRTRLAPGGRIYVESPRGFVVGDDWTVLREGRAGQVVFRMIVPNEPDAQT
jgi:16S rRNA (guanine966-N2)-methyltransferase